MFIVSDTSLPLYLTVDVFIVSQWVSDTNCVPVPSQLFNTQAQSLLLMTSVAMPVFSKKKETVSGGLG